MSNEKEKLQPGNAYRYVEPVEPRAIVTSHRQRAKEAKRKMWEIPGLNESDILSFRQKRARKNAVIKFILVGQVKMLLAEKAKYFEAQAEAAGNKVIERTFSKNLQLCEEAIAAVDNIEGCKNDQILINQDTQTTILNSILSGQQNDALQYVAMSEKLDNLTELVSALGTKTNELSFAENANKLLENFATSQEAAFAKVTKKEDLKHVDTGIDSIINMLSDNSIT